MPQSKRVLWCIATIVVLYEEVNVVFVAIGWYQVTSNGVRAADESLDPNNEVADSRESALCKRGGNVSDGRAESRKNVGNGLLCTSGGCRRFRRSDERAWHQIRGILRRRRTTSGAMARKGSE